jgi:uncharacterized membrane protein YecN with MAPEG domain
MTIVTLYAGLLGLLYLPLAANVIRIRRADRISLGDGGNALLERRVRAHGNFAEYVPIALILIALAESGGGSALLIHGLGIALVLGRAMHAFALSSLTLRLKARVGGMVLTLTVIGIAAATCVGIAVQAMAQTS